MGCGKEGSLAGKGPRHSGAGEGPEMQCDMQGKEGVSDGQPRAGAAFNPGSRQEASDGFRTARRRHKSLSVIVKGSLIRL